MRNKYEQLRDVFAQTFYRENLNETAGGSDELLSNNWKICFSLQVCESKSIILA